MKGQVEVVGEDWGGLRCGNQVDVCRFLGGIKNEQAYCPFGFVFLFAVERGMIKM